MHSGTWPTEGTAGLTEHWWAFGARVEIAPNVRLPELESQLQPLFLRLLCHCLVEQVPDRGLQEVHESLHGLRDYYSALIAQPLPPEALPHVRQLEASIGQRLEPSPFELDPED